MPRDVSDVLCDLDGVVWLAHTPIPGSVDAIGRLQASGRRVWFVTNNSAATRSDQAGALRAIGIAVESSDVVSSAMAGASLVAPGERVLVSGGPGVVEALAARGVVDVVVNTGVEVDGPFDAVVVGLHREFDYARLRVAGHAIHRGARLIGTNGDTTYPTPHGLDPGGGSLVAAVASVGGVEAVYAGKPEQPMADLLAELIGRRNGGGVDGNPGAFDPRTTVMVGDRLDTDGLFAQRLGCPFALVDSGVTSPDQAVDGVDLRFDDLSAMVDALES